MAECEMNLGCKEKFQYMDMQMRELITDSKDLKRKTDENENGKVIAKMQVMFDVMKEESKKVEAHAEKREALVEARAEKRDFAISQIGTDLNKYANTSEKLTLKVSDIGDKVNALEIKVNDNAEKTKIDTSLWFKAGIFGIGSGSIIIVAALIKSFFNL